MDENQLKSFTIVNQFLGYRDKRDITKTPAGFCVSGSLNVQIIDDDKIGVRAGTSYLGVRSTNLFGIGGGGNWKTSSGTELPWRSFYNGSNGVIEVYVGGAWETLISSLSTSGKFRSIPWFSSTEAQDLLLLVNGQPDIYMWSGCTTTYASDTVNTITKQGATTWAEDRALTAGTRGVRIKDDTGTWRSFTYTGGEGTDTLTGVAPDPTAFAFTAGAKVLQDVRTTSNKPSATKSNDFLAVYLNHLFVFDEQLRTIEMSKNTDYTDFAAASSPRVAGEAGTFNLDQEPTAAATQPDGDSLYISTRDQWYQFTFASSADQTKEVIDITPLKTSPFEGASNSVAIAQIKNNVVFVNGEPTVNTLGQVENVTTPQSTPLSDDIKKYMDGAGTSTSVVGFYKNNVYNAVREKAADGANNRLLVRNLATGSWEAPWTIPASAVFEYNGDLYTHDPGTTNTYKVFDDSFSDLTQKDSNGNITTDGAPIVAKWFSPHESFGLPFNQKTFDKLWVDGYIRASTTLNIFITYDFGEETKKYKLVGTNTDVVVTPSGGGLGTYSLGTRNLGGRGQTLSASGLKRFRGFIPVPERPFYELQISFQSTGVGYRWEVTSYGMNVRKKLAQNNNKRIA